MNTFVKTIILASITIPLFSVVSFAEPPGDAAFKKVKLLKKRLELTDKQADSMYSILKEYAYRQCDDVTSFTKKSECFKNVHSSKDAKMKSILTETQKTQLEEFIIECQKNHGPRNDTSKKEYGEKASCSK